MNQKGLEDFYKANHAEAQPGAPAEFNLEHRLLNTPTPGHGEIVGGADAKLADELVSLARSKGGKDKVQAKLRVIREQSRYEGQAEADKLSTKQLIEVQQRMAERVVCGFIAEVGVAQQMYRGLPESMVWSMNSLTVTKIVDALNDAGYTVNGRRT